MLLALLLAALGLAAATAVSAHPMTSSSNATTELAPRFKQIAAGCDGAIYCLTCVGAGTVAATADTSQFPQRTARQWSIH